MRALDARDILELADRGAAAWSARRALLVLAAAFPEAGADTIAAAALSLRDRALLDVRARLFGPMINAQDQCDHCGVAVEVSLTAADIGLSPVDPPFPPAPAVTLAGQTVRAVTGGDAAEMEEIADPDEARAWLVRHVMTGPEAGEIHGDKLDEALEQLDPAADVELVLSCPECGESTARAFDAATFVWQEFVATVPRIMADVADLAREFHWSERDILALPAARRAFYLAEARA